MSLAPLVCTADVENGSDLITVHGVVLSPARVIAGAAVYLAGASYSVEAYVSTTQAQLSRVYEGADEDGVTCEIAQWTQEMLSRVDISQQLRDYNARVALVNNYSKGPIYTCLGYTAAGDPGAGCMARSAVGWADATTWYLDQLNAGGNDESPRLLSLPVGTVLTARSLLSGAYASVKLTEVPTNSDGFFTLHNLEWIGLDAVYGGPADGETTVACEILLVGEGLAYEKHSPNVAGLSAYTATAGIKVLVSDTGSGRAGIYTRNAAASAWIGPAYIDGPAGADGATVGEVLSELGLHSVTISVSDPSGGVDGDLWLKVAS